jgi:hypothetical protein
MCPPSDIFSYAPLNPSITSRTAEKYGADKKGDRPPCDHLVDFPRPNDAELNCFGGILAERGHRSATATAQNKYMGEVMGLKLIPIAILKLIQTGIAVDSRAAVALDGAQDLLGG